MPNYVPYVVLMAVSVGLFVYIWRKGAGKRLVPFWLCVTGLIYLFEFVILVLFKSYEYSPGVFKNKYFDNIFGASVSDGFIVPAITSLIAVSDLGFWWIVLSAVAMAGVEWFFLHIGIYRHFWWKVPYTAVCLVFDFYLGKWVWGLIRCRSERFLVRLIVLFFANFSLQATVIFYLCAIFQIMFYRVNWFDNPSRGHIAFATL